MDDAKREAMARYAMGQPSSVSDRGSYGWLNDQMIQKSGGEVHDGTDRVSVSYGYVYVNGRYVGPAPR